MIDPTREHLISLAEAAALLPGRRVGRRCSLRTIWRYVADGRLETIRVGGKRATSREAVARFIAASSGQPSRHSPALAPRDRAEQAGQRLDRIGI